MSKNRRCAAWLTVLALTSSACLGSEGENTSEWSQEALMAAAVDSIIVQLQGSAVVCLVVDDGDGVPLAPSHAFMEKLQSRVVVPPEACPETYTSMIRPVDSLGRPVVREPPDGHVDPVHLRVVRFDADAYESASIGINQSQGTLGRAYLCFASMRDGEPQAACRIVSSWIS